MEDISLVTVPFGKYKGKSVLELIGDKSYVDWLKQQSWFSGQKQIYNIVVNQTINTTNSKTPEHNRLQNLFLDKQIQLKLLKIVYGNIHKDFNNKMKAMLSDDNFINLFGNVDYQDLNYDQKCSDVKFEGEYNWDVILSYHQQKIFTFPQIKHDNVGSLLSGDSKIIYDKINLLISFRKQVDLLYPNNIERAYSYQEYYRINVVVDGASISGEMIGNCCLDICNMAKKSFCQLGRYVWGRDELTLWGKKQLFRVDVLDGYLREISLRQIIIDKHNHYYNCYLSALKIPKLCYCDDNNNYMDIDAKSSDILLTYSFDQRLAPVYFELKPLLGDDYPNVLRKMNNQIKLSKRRNAVLIVDKFDSSTTTKQQLIEIFNQHDIRIIFKEQLVDGDKNNSPSNHDQEIKLLKEKITEHENIIDTLKQKIRLLES